MDIVKYEAAFTFIYSKRTGTPAANMSDQIDEKEAKESFNRLLDAVNPIVYELNTQKVGKTYKILVDGVSSDPLYVTGRTEDNTLVHFKACEELIGEIVDVKITDCKTFYLIGELQ